MKNIIITGGELFNKGAQAMTFIAVDEMKKRFPNHRVLVLSEMDLQRPVEERRIYTFDFMGWYPLKFAKCQTNPILRALCLLRNRRELLEAENIYKNTELMIDISGYALGSNWSVGTCHHYLDHLEFAKAFDIPVYLMPQSFGPFNFQGKEGKKVDRRIAKLLPTAKVICAREQDGFEMLTEHYHLKNVICANDMVVNNRGVELAHIYKTVPKPVLPDIVPGSVAVIPNQMNYAVADHAQVQGLYISAIKALLRNKLTVYLLSHADADKTICRQLKDVFSVEDRVILIDRELNCIEFNEVVKQFQFVVASRFHALIHAFKNSIPCIAIGWATKYHDLMGQFSQEQYMLDVRTQINVYNLDAAIESIIANRNESAQAIQKALDKFQKYNIFEIIEV